MKNYLPFFEIIDGMVCRTPDQAASAKQEWHDRIMIETCEKTGKTRSQLINEGYGFVYTSSNNSSGMTITFEKV